MKKIYLCLISALFLCSVNTAFALSFKDYLPSQQGRGWEYLLSDSTTTSYSISGTRNINGVDTKVYTQGTFGEFYFINNSNGLNVYGADNTITTPGPINMIGADFSIGDIFSNTFEMDVPNVGINNLTLKTEILGFEDVAVAGYIGEALKIELLSINNTKETDTGNLWRHTEVAWFASDIGLVKTTNNTTHNDFIFGFDMELQSYAAPVPEPTTIVLFGLGLLGLAGVNRRKE